LSFPPSEADSLFGGTFIAIRPPTLEKYRRTNVKAVAELFQSAAGRVVFSLARLFRIEDESRIGFWDALIVSSASKNGAARILSEDFNAGQRIAGILIENPFVDVH
jgi:predicted nucleic acid-binding protein